MALYKCVYYYYYYYYTQSGKKNGPLSLKFSHGQTVASGLIFSHHVFKYTITPSIPLYLQVRSQQPLIQVLGICHESHQNGETRPSSAAESWSCLADTERHQRRIQRVNQTAQITHTLQKEQHLTSIRQNQVNLSHDELITRSTRHIVNLSQSTCHTTNSSHGQVVTLSHYLSLKPKSKP